MAMLDTVKGAIPTTETAYDAELTQLIATACADLGIVGVTAETATTDPLLTRAIVTYCRMNFLEPDNYDKLKASYDEQKAQLITATGYGLPEV